MPFLISNGVLHAYIPEQNDTDLVIPDGVTAIDKAVFFKNDRLRRVVIPDHVREIGVNVFSGCTALEEVTLPAHLQEISWGLLADCRSLAQVQIPESVIRIGSDAFKNCQSLKNVRIPARTMAVGWSAFEGCSALSCVRLPAGMTSLGKSAFFNCPALHDLLIEVRQSEPPCLLRLHCADMEGMVWEDVRALLQHRSFTRRMDKGVKYAMAAQMFLALQSPEAEAFIRQHKKDLLCTLIDADDYESVKGLFESGRFVNRKSILYYVDYAIRHTDNGGDFQIQSFISGYRASHFPEAHPTDNWNL